MGKIKDRYEAKVLPVIIDKLCGSPDMRPHRAATVANTHGTVLEIGFGSGHNLALYPSSVQKLLVVEPSTKAIELAKVRTARAPFPVEVVGLNGESLPIADNSVDCVVSTFVLCTIPNVTAALSEIHRVLKPNGTFHVLEHGLADDTDASVQRWQHRLNPLQRQCFGGCNLVRHTPTMLTSAGFNITEQHRWYARGPKAMSAFTRAVATQTSH
jgi:ubiquinone/menaquinone biosynthesis C-methylase UbiE